MMHSFNNLERISKIICPNQEYNLIDILAIKVISYTEQSEKRKIISFEKMIFLLYILYIKFQSKDLESKGKKSSDILFMIGAKIINYLKEDNYMNEPEKFFLNRITIYEKQYMQYREINDLINTLKQLIDNVMKEGVNIIYTEEIPFVLNNIMDDINAQIELSAFFSAFYDVVKKEIQEIIKFL